MARLTDLHHRRVFLDTNIVVYIVEGFEPFGPVLRAVLAAMDGGAPTAVTSELTLRSTGIDAAVSAMNVEAKDPGIVDSLKKVGVAIAAPAVAVAGFALSLLPVARDAQKAAAEKVKAAPEAYLMYVKEGLTPATMLDWVRQGTRKFVLGV